MRSNFVSIPTELLLMLVIVGILIFVWDLLDRRVQSTRSSAGFDAGSKIVEVKGSKESPTVRLSSSSLGLSSEPDAIVEEEGFLIPVDVVPMSSKVQDRHVIQMLAHLALISEREQKTSPYGILRMGKKGRIVRIKNSPEKQRWLTSLLEEMRAIEGGVPAVPKPSFKKCKACQVKEVCEHSAA